MWQWQVRLLILLLQALGKAGPEIDRALRGKKVAILGARSVGKTRLVEFLSSGSLPQTTRQNVAPEKKSGRTFQLRNLALKVKDTQDVPGDKTAYADWKDLHNDADLVLYLLRADRLLVSDHAEEERVREDLRHIGSWLDARTPRPPFFIIGTHCDLVPTFDAQSAADVDMFRRLPIVSELLARGGGSHAARVVLGSMQDIPHTELLVYQIFMQVLS